MVATGRRLAAAGSVLGLQRRVWVRLRQTVRANLQYGPAITTGRLIPPHSGHSRRPGGCFLGNFAGLVKQALLWTTASTPIEIWFQDEARVGQKGTHAYIWGPIGSRPLMVRDNRHESAYIFGAICPARAVGAAMLMPAAHAEAMNEHLKKNTTKTAPGTHP